MKKISERSAWLYLEKCCHDVVQERFFRMGPYGFIGLCCAIDHMRRDKLITKTVHDRMIMRIRDYAESRGKSVDRFIWAQNKVGHRRRAEFCAQQAALLERKKRAEK